MSRRSGNEEDAAAPAARRAPGWRFYALLWLGMMALRQDFWLWDDATLLFGLLPVGLAWQAGYSVLAALVLWWLVRIAWPSHLEALEDERGQR